MLAILSPTLHTQFSALGVSTVSTLQHASARYLRIRKLRRNGLAPIRLERIGRVAAQPRSVGAINYQEIIMPHGSSWTYCVTY